MILIRVARANCWMPIQLALNALSAIRGPKFARAYWMGERSAVVASALDSLLYMQFMHYIEFSLCNYAEFLVYTMRFRVQLGNFIGLVASW
jgi:hypothetical protein